MSFLAVQLRISCSDNQVAKEVPSASKASDLTMELSPPSLLIQR